LLVVRVEDNSPAEKGGLLVGDVLVAIDGRTVDDADDLLGMLSGDRVGKSVPILVLRGGQTTTLNAVIGQRS
jgi:S1-C subfamily serine protease